MTTGDPAMKSGAKPVTAAPPAPGGSPEGHGAVGTRERQFTSLLPSDHPDYGVHKLFVLANQMKAGTDTVKDGVDPEENIWVPAGYTYFGQFVDHDLTFDSTSSLSRDDIANRIPTNLRTPRFDLDCVYGDGPDSQPFMYANDGATLLLGGHGRDINGVQTADFELLRSSNGRAIIGDKRNDENSIVSQIQQGFIKAHNAVVDVLSQRDPSKWTAPNDLFSSARNEIRWTYQRLVLEDFLPRIVNAEVFADLAVKPENRTEASYALYTKDLRRDLPREFVVAAYRFGHSGVRFGYRLNRRTRLSIFPGTDGDPSGESLLGFDPLPKSHVIDDWGRFFPDGGPRDLPTAPRTKAKDELMRPDVRLQYAYKLDPTLVDPLAALPVNVAGGSTVRNAIKTIEPDTLPTDFRPSLALLNLLRGNSYGIQGGQAFAAKPKAKFPKVAALTPDQLVVRVPAAGDGNFKFEPIDPALQADTPLWFYILAEAQAPVVDFIVKTKGKNKPFSEDLLVNGDGAKTQLGWVGGRIVAEVFYGLMDADDQSLFKAPKDWKPVIDAKNLKDFLEFPGKAAAIA